MSSTTIRIGDKTYELNETGAFGARVFHRTPDGIYDAEDVDRFLTILRQALEHSGVFSLYHRPDYDDADENGIRFHFDPSHYVDHPHDYYWDGGGGTLAKAWVDFIYEVFTEIFGEQLSEIEEEIRDVYWKHVAKEEKKI